MIFEQFNPLNKENIIQITINAFLSQPLFEMPPEKFEGAGVYGIWTDQPDLDYFHDRTKPIYIGKAENGSRKGQFGSGKNKLSKRLGEHSFSINKASNLDIRNFKCRFLVLDDFWIPATETRLIEYFQPVWNVSLDGFGTRYTGIHRNAKGKWDVIHPGRDWDESCREPQKTKEQIIKDINYGTE